MNGLLTLTQAIATFITGPFGVSVIVIAVAIMFKSSGRTHLD